MRRFMFNVHQAQWFYGAMRPHHSVGHSLYLTTRAFVSIQFRRG